MELPLKGIHCTDLSKKNKVLTFLYIPLEDFSRAVGASALVGLQCTEFSIAWLIAD